MKTQGNNIFNVRLSQAEHRKLLDLAAQANDTPSGVMRALLRSAKSVRPAQPATAIFESGDGAQTVNQYAVAS